MPSSRLRDPQPSAHHGDHALNLRAKDDPCGRSRHGYRDATFVPHGKRAIDWIFTRVGAQRKPASAEDAAMCRTLVTMHCPGANIAFVRGVLVRRPDRKIRRNGRTVLLKLHGFVGWAATLLLLFFVREDAARHSVPSRRHAPVCVSCELAHVRSRVRPPAWPVEQRHADCCDIESSCGCLLN